MRRLHSLSGIILAFAYVLCFLVPFSGAIGGEGSFNRFAALAAKIPMLDAFEVVVVGIPLIFHAALGLSIVYSSQFNIVSYGFYRNWMYALQRVTGILLVPFLAYHIYVTRLAFAFTGRYADFAFMHKFFAPSWVSSFYIAGVICASFHIGNGLATALMRWGITVSRRAQDAASMTMWVLTFILAAWGVRVVTAF